MSHFESRDDICLGNDRYIPFGICIPDGIHLPYSSDIPGKHGGYIRTFIHALSLVLRNQSS